MLRRSLFAVFVPALMSIAPFAHAQTYTYFPNNATINYAITADETIVGYASGNFTNGFQVPSSPTVNLVGGGDIGRYLSAFNSSTVNVSGGKVFFSLFAYDTATINMSGGTTGVGLFAYNTGVINLSGGSIGGTLGTRNNGVINLSGGSVAFELSARNNGVINIFGTNLTSRLIDPNSGGGFSSLYNVSGTLLDGNVLTNKALYVQNGTSARFTLNNVPEPGFLALLISVIPGTMLLRRRRRKSVIGN